jgi:hypothetical protein
MIKFKAPEERRILLHYAAMVDNNKIESILNEGLKSSSEAKELARFFWFIVDQSSADYENGVTVLGFDNLQSWCEDIMQSLRSHFVSTGYIEIWEDESDKS